MKTLLVIVVGCFVIPILGVAATQSGGVSGGALLVMGATAYGVSALRGTQRLSRIWLAIPNGLGLGATLLVVLMAVVAALGNNAWRAEQVKAAEKQAAAQATLEQLVTELPAVAGLVEDATKDFDGGTTAAVDARLHDVAHHFEPLRTATSYSAKPEVGAAFAALSQARNTIRAAREAAVVRGASAALAVQGLSSLDGLLDAQAALKSLEQPSTVAATQASAVDVRLMELTHGLPALGHSEAVLRAKAGRVTTAGEGVRLQGLPKAMAMAYFKNGKCTSLYMSPEPVAATLPDTTVSQFLTIAIAAPPASAALLVAPTKDGSVATAPTIAGIRVQARWSNQRLVELWVGDFQP